MAVRKIIRMGHPTLRKVASPVPDEMLGSAEIITEKKRLIERIFDSFIKLINREHHTRGE